MARYFIDVINGSGLVTDDEGEEYKSDEDMRLAAMRLLTDLARDEVSHLFENQFRVSVRNGVGEAIYEASLGVSENWLPGKNAGA